MSKLEELYTAYREATKEEDDLRRKRYARKAELEAKTTETLSVEFGESMAIAAIKRYEAGHDLNLEKERVALEANNGAYPLGTVMRKWDYNKWDRTWKRTDKTGVVEVWTTKSDGKQTDWSSTASVGDYIIRFKKKDGSLGKHYVTLNSHARGEYWRPEGIDRNAKTEGDI